MKYLEGRKKRVFRGAYDSNQDPRWSQKPRYIYLFTHHIYIYCEYIYFLVATVSDSAFLYAGLVGTKPLLAVSYWFEAGSSAARSFLGENAIETRGGAA